MESNSHLQVRAAAKKRSKGDECDDSSGDGDNAEPKTKKRRAKTGEVKAKGKAKSKSKAKKDEEPTGSKAEKGPAPTLNPNTEVPPTQPTKENEVAPEVPGSTTPATEPTPAEPSVDLASLWKEKDSYDVTVRCCPNKIQYMVLFIWPTYISSVVGPEEPVLRTAGIPMDDGFVPTKKSWTIPAASEGTSSIGILPGSQMLAIHAIVFWWNHIFMYMRWWYLSLCKLTTKASVYLFFVVPGILHEQEYRLSVSPLNQR